MTVGKFIEMLQQYPIDMDIEIVEEANGFKSRIIGCDTAIYAKPFLQILIESCKNGRGLKDCADCIDEGSSSPIASIIHATVRKYSHPDCEVSFQSEVSQKDS